MSAKTFENPCGYDNKLVWTSDRGGALPPDTVGRLFSETAFEGISQLTVDLREVKIVRGIQLQGPVPELPFNGIFCFWYTFGLGPWILGSTLFLAVQCSHYPLRAVQRGYFGTVIILIGFGVADFFFVAIDPASPGYFSYNPVCKTNGDSYISRLTAIVAMMIGLVVAIILPIVRPKKTAVVLATVIFLGMFLWTMFFGHNLNLAWMLLVFGICTPVLLKVLSQRNKRFAKGFQKNDIDKYEDEWKRAKEALDTAQQDSAQPLQLIKLVSLRASKILDKRKRVEYSRTDFRRGTRPLFWIRAGAMGRYTRTQKFGQQTADIDMLFEEATIVNDDFLNLLQEKIVDKVNAVTAGSNCELVHGIVKRPDRALQKVVRRYHRDPRNLTDLVRGCIIASSIHEVWLVLEEILRQCDIHAQIESSCREQPRTSSSLSGEGAFSSDFASTFRSPIRKFLKTSKVDADEETEFLVGNTDDDAIPAFFRLCKIKDRFSAEKSIGYRDVCLGLEVGWDVKSEGRSLDFVPVGSFGKKHVRTHICEVQVMLRSMYEVKSKGAHGNFVEARNLLCH